MLSPGIPGLQPHLLRPNDSKKMDSVKAVEVRLERRRGDCIDPVVRPQSTRSLFQEYLITSWTRRYAAR